MHYGYPAHPQGFTCKCGGLRPAPGVALGYAGPMCGCGNPQPQEQSGGMIGQGMYGPQTKSLEVNGRTVVLSEEQYTKLMELLK